MGALQLHVNNYSSFVSEKRKSKNVPIALSRCNWSCFSGWHQREVFVVVAAVICVVSASLSTSENIKNHTRHQSLWNGDSSLWKHTHTYTCTHSQCIKMEIITHSLQDWRDQIFVFSSLKCTLSQWPYLQISMSVTRVQRSMLAYFLNL